jgi:hypothetical protein
MKKFICMVVCCIGAVALFHLALAAQPKKTVAHPAATSSSIPGATTAPGFHMPPAALQREVQQLERAAHLLEMSSQNDYNSHEAVAARHLHTAINELKLEAKKNAQAKQAAQVTEAASATAPSARSSAASRHP